MLKLENNEVKNVLLPGVFDEERKIGTNPIDKLLSERIIMLSGQVTDEMAQSIISQLLWLEREDSEKDIQIYINSPGGSITAGLGIYDTMRIIKPEIRTICVGLAASMGAFLLSAGTKGKRYVTKYSTVMIHQPLISGGLSGKASEIEIYNKMMQRNKITLSSIMAENMGKTLDEVLELTHEDNWLTSEEALELGLVDKII